MSDPPPAEPESEATTRDTAPERTSEPSNERPWVIATIAVFVLATLGVAFGGYYIYQRAEQSPMARLLGSGAELMLDAHDQPGAQALRKVGCRQALVLNVDKLTELLVKLERPSAKPREELPDLLAVCRYEPEKAKTSGTDLSCDALAQKLIARSTPGPGRTFALVVRPLDADYQPGPPACAATYDAGGKRVGDYDVAWLPLPDPKEIDLAQVR